MSVEIIEKDLSYKIIEAAYEVHNQLGPGFLESIYQGAILALVVNFGGIRLQYARVVHTKIHK